MSPADERIEAAAKAFYEMHHAYDSRRAVPWEQYEEKDAPWYRSVAEVCLAAADAVKGERA